ncbi:hypothetical protein FRC12_016804 [Ceratobasidium sp. 428]|nr:hypothetical protein FRC12_016804 [Ceratobasidium sp. 428]
MQWHQWPPLQRRRRKYKPKAGEINRALESALLSWREEVYERDFSYLPVAPNAILNNGSIDSIARRSGSCKSEKLQVILDVWGYWDEYGDELLARIQVVLPEPPAPPEPTCRARVPNRKAQPSDKPPVGKAQDMPNNSSKATRRRAKHKLPEDNTESVNARLIKRQKK